ncbi:hypothetical protein M407DRAFT_176188 [Tulasnella calospora MUT 4182]|uniref:Uncharacterized protein n=1 Tax=Tulasnella calospora MUT 4182 TaxID=1051891 RepID=A0A0C3PR78_9AGAM|nr:hypothetical protein M407DRAFT_176188 [Tulasnella calospora MUT 4182]
MLLDGNTPRYTYVLHDFIVIIDFGIWPFEGRGRDSLSKDLRSPEAPPVTFSPFMCVDSQHSTRETNRFKK